MAGIHKKADKEVALQANLICRDCRTPGAVEKQPATTDGPKGGMSFMISMSLKT